MTYGRLDIFLPDGQFKTYPLDEDRISIGRSPGSSITIDSDSLSRYHASITFENHEVVLTDLESVNGTYVDGIRLESNTPHVLYGGEEIGIGDLRMIFQTLDDSPTRPIIILEDVTRRLERTELPFYVEIEEPEHAIPPGAHISATVTITNTGTVARRFKVEVGGLPEGWARLDRREIEIAPAGNGIIVVNFKPRRQSDSAPGAYNVTLTISTVDDATLKLSGVVILQLLPFGGFGLTLEPSEGKVGAPLVAHLHNQGSAPLPIRLIVRDNSDSLRITVEPNQFVIAPGQHVSARVTAQPRRLIFFGDPRQHSFDLVARSSDMASFFVPVRATLEERPVLPGWAAFAVGGLGVAITAILLVLLAIVLLPSSSPPTITQFVLSAERVAQGDPVQATWDTTNADSITVLVDGVEVERAITPTGTLTLDTSEFFGMVEVALMASGRREEARVVVPLTIYLPLSVESFTYSPRPLMQFVTQTFVISWSVPGATISRVEGLGDFTTATTDTSFGAAGTITAAGIAFAPLTVTLYAEGDESVLQQMFVIEMNTPKCSALTADVLLRSLPSPTGQVIGTIQQGAPSVTVDAQDISGQWLRVPLTGGAQGWGERTALTCEATFVVADLFTDIAVVVPPPAVLPPTAAVTGAPLATANTLEPTAPVLVVTPAG